jgi:hypothetical protein
MVLRRLSLSRNETAQIHLVLAGLDRRGPLQASALGALHFDFPKAGAFAAILFVIALLAMRSPSTTCGPVTTVTQADFTPHWENAHEAQ